MLTLMMLIYLATGSVFAMLVLIWAVRTRQFEQQERARWLALRGLTDEELAHPPSRKLTPSVGMVFVILGVGLGSQLVLLVLVLGGGG